MCREEGRRREGDEGILISENGGWISVYEGKKGKKKKRRGKSKPS